MERQTSSSVLIVAALAGGIGFVAFVALMVLGGFTVSPAAFLAILVALAAAIVLFSGFHRGPERELPRLKPSEDGKLGNVTREAGTAGVAKGSAGMGRPGATASAGTAAGMAPTPDHTGDAAGTAPSPATGGMPDPTPAGASGGAAPETTDPGRAVSGNAPGSQANKWSSSQLDGETELSERKGDWAYKPDAKRGTKAIEGDGEGDSEHSVVEMEPQRLDAPREGGADDLKQIKGVGPKLEEMLNGMGIYHFDQIASWSEEELAWVDERLEGFKGRASRDEWVSQAKTLSAA